MTLSRRHLDVSFILGEGQFGTSGKNTVTVAGLRCMAQIAKAGGLSQSQLNLRVYGLTLSTMNALSTLGKPLSRVYRNLVEVRAYSDEAPQPALVFRGTIQDAWSDMNASPDAAFVVTAFQGLWENNNPAPPKSYNGAVDVALIMQQIAQGMGLNFENNGVSVILRDQYLSGTLFAQAKKAAQAANINWIMDDTTLAIWPKTGFRGGPPVVKTPSTGLAGYPTHTANGLAFMCEYDPSIRFGGQVTVKESIIGPANNTWTVFNIVHDLESETFGGAWFTHMDCVALGQPLPVS